MLGVLIPCYMIESWLLLKDLRAIGNGQIEPPKASEVPGRTSLAGCWTELDSSSGLWLSWRPVQRLSAHAGGPGRKPGQ